MCKEDHPTRLHGYKSKSKESVAGGSQSSEEKSADSGEKKACASEVETSAMCC